MMGLNRREEGHPRLPRAFQLQELNAYRIRLQDEMHEIARHLHGSASDQLQLSLILGIY